MDFCLSIGIIRIYNNFFREGQIGVYRTVYPTMSLRTSAHTGVAIRSPKRYVFNDTTNKMVTIRGCGLPRRGIAPPRNDMIDGASQLYDKLQFEQQYRTGRSGPLQFAP